MPYRFFASPLARKFYFTVALFAVSAIIGYRTTQGALGPEAGEDVLRAFADLVGAIGDRGPLALMTLIFLNNAIKALAVVLLGFSLGLVPFIYVVVNGLVVGLAIGTVSARVGPGPVLMGILPHGIIEVPAFLLAAALGFQVGGAVFRRIIGREASPGKELRNGLGIYFKFILPALLIASAIEAFITPAIVGTTI